MIKGSMMRTWKTVKHHVPLIKFRKGGPYTENTSASTQSANTSKSTAGPLGASQHGVVIEDWQLPPHYRRAPLDEQEMDAINSGGAI